MTNLQIIISESLLNGIYTQEQIDSFVSEGDIPLKTFKEWYNIGYIVKRGEKAILKTRLWKLKPQKEESSPDEFILVPANLFSIDQVKKIG